MLSVTDLPVEIQLKLVRECPALRGVNRQFYKLSNEHFRNKTLSWLRCSITLADYNWFWECCEGYIKSYVESLDFLRRDARKIICTEQPFIEDSWCLVFNALNSTLNCRNNSNLVRSLDSLDYHRPIFTGRSTLPYSRVHDPTPINGWFHIKSLEGTYKLATLVTEIRISPYDKYKTISMPANIKDFVREPGIYCFNMGQIPTFDGPELTAGNPLLPFEIRLMERAMTPPSYFEHSDLLFLGYDFVRYERHRPWLFFHIDEKFKEMIFNPMETCLSESLVKFTKTFRHSNLSLQSIMVKQNTEPYFNEGSKPIRYFNYKYPRDQPNIDKEKTLPDWRAPHLTF